MHDNLLSNIAFNCSLRHYSAAQCAHVTETHSCGGNIIHYLRFVYCNPLGRGALQLSTSSHFPSATRRFVIETLLKPC